MIRQISPFLILLFISCDNDPCDTSLHGIDTMTQEVYTDFDRVENLSGKITDLNLTSKYLNESRRVTIYEPPNYDSDDTYGVLFVTDDIGAHIPYYIEHLILENEIEPIFVVGVYNRALQPIDSIFDDYDYDFRNMEFMKDEVLFRSLKDEKLTEGTHSDIFMIHEAPDVIENEALHKIVSSRYERFCSYLNHEVIPYLQNHYSITTDSDKWTLGGFSSGGAFVFSYSCDHPDIFGNVIVMSPAGPFDNYDFSNAASNYFVAAGNQEPFIKESLKYLDTFDSLKIPYIHQTYNAGHDWNMWLTFYLEALKKIYCNN